MAPVVLYCVLHEIDVDDGLKVVVLLIASF
jgi:hypothetical protein